MRSFSDEKIEKEKNAVKSEDGVEAKRVIDQGKAGLKINYMEIQQKQKISHLHVLTGRHQC